MTQLIDLGKLRFHFAGAWSPTTTYEINDVVKYGGNVYVYTSSVRTNGNLPTDVAYWTLMVEGFKFQGNFDEATQYRIGDGVAHGGVVYIAIADSQGQTPPNPTYWSQFVDGIQFEGEYDPTTAYQKSDVVTYGAQAYIAIQDSTGALPTNPSSWVKFVSGISAEGVYNDATEYVPGDVVAYGANLYVNILESTGNIPTDTNFWEVYIQGNDYQGEWLVGNNYLVGQTVRFGGNIYQALTNNTGQEPSSSTSDWQLFFSGINNRGDWETATFYAINDVVTHGGNTYVALVSHTSSVFDDDLTASPDPYWQKYNSGVRYMGVWSTGTEYLKDDIVSFSVSTYIASEDHVAGADFFIDNNAGKWSSFVVGAEYVLPDTTGNAGKYLQTPDGINYSWQFPGENDKVFYVSQDATSSADDNNHGKSVDYAFASVKFACEFIAADLANRSPATIFVKDGIYQEQLPITVPPNVTIVGDGLRNTIIEPDTTNDNGFGVGISDDGVTPNAETNMFLINSGAMFRGLMFRGLTGFAPSVSDAEDITTATTGGVYFQLAPNAQIIKSPYIKDCSCFSVGGATAAIVDGGDADPNAGKPASMVFHAFTVVFNGGGIGFWIKDKGLAEIVSCFTYYCNFGYAASGGGKIRALNGNNSYGEYGAYATGFDETEVPVDGVVKADVLSYDVSTLTGGNFTDGQTLDSGANVQLAVSSLSIAAESVVTTSSPHGLRDGQGIAFSDIGEAAWQSLLGDKTLTDHRNWYADVIDSTSFKICTDPTLNNYFDTRNVAGYGIVPLTITDATRSNPVILTITGHGFTSGEAISDIANVGGMTELNGNTYYVNVLTTDTIELYTDAGLTTTLDGTAFGAYTSGGTATRTLVGTAFTTGNVNTTYTEATIKNVQTNFGDGTHRILVTDIRYGNSGQTYKVSVGPSGVGETGNRFYFNGTKAPALDVWATRQYIFDQSDSSNDGHPIYLSTTQDGAHAGGAVYNTGVTYWLDGAQVADFANYSLGFAAANTREVRISIDVSLVDTTLYYVCQNHSGMGGTYGSLNISADIQAELEYSAGPFFQNFADGETITSGVVEATLSNPGAQKGLYGFILYVEGLEEEPREGGSIQLTTGPAYDAVNGDINYENGEDTRSFIINTVTGYTPWDSNTGTGGAALITLTEEKLETSQAFYGQHINLRYNYSQVRLTGHDFLDIGTGNFTTTNYPGVPTQAKSQGNEVVEQLPGRVYYVSTDQDGNVRIGNFFSVNQATGRATLDASAFDLSGLTSLRLGSIGAQIGEAINEFSSDGTLAGNSNTAVPTEQATKTYVDSRVAADFDYDNTASGIDATDVQAAIDETISIAKGAGGSTKAYDSANTTENADGFITSATIGNITYSNIVYETAGFIADNDQYRRVASYRETNGSESKDVTITYNEDGSVNTVTVVEV